jgi:hypothetical protein
VRYRAEPPVGGGGVTAADVNPLTTWFRSASAASTGTTIVTIAAEGMSSVLWMS